MFHIPYCGAPPSPGTLLERWNIDPVLITVLVAVIALYGLASFRSSAVKGRYRACFFAGWLLTSAALISPLCPLSVSLFAARVGQHAILILVAAPLIIAGRPGLIFGAWLPRSRVLTDLLLVHVLRAPLFAAALFAGFLWFWHMPLPYTATFDSNVTYWLMHLTLFGSALLLWSVLFTRVDANLPQIIAAGILSSIQMTFLGALITLSPRALYAPHILTTAAWGLSPLQDQELGGLIMWVPGCAVFLGVALFGLFFAMRRADRAYA